MLTGTLAYTQSVGGEPGRLFADLSAARLDLSTAPDISGLAARAKAMDLSLRLDAQAVKIGNVGQGSLDTGRIEFRLEKTGALAKLDELTVTDLGGANIHAQGHWDGHAGTFTGTLDSDKLDALAELAHRLAPGAASDLFVARAGVLAPAHLTLSAQAMADANGAITLDQFDLKGSAAGTNIAATINGKIGTDRQNPADLMLVRQTRRARCAHSNPSARSSRSALAGPRARHNRHHGFGQSRFDIRDQSHREPARRDAHLRRRSSAGRDRAFGDRHICNWTARVSQRFLKRRGSPFPIPA